MRLALFARKMRAWLHLVLVAGIFLYLYSPLLDHWIGNDAHSRPHNHTHVALSELYETAHNHEVAVGGEHGEHKAHGDGVLCLLDIEAFLSLVYTFVDAEPFPVEPHNSLVLSAFPAYSAISVIYLSSLDPPPNI